MKKFMAMLLILLLLFCAAIPVGAMGETTVYVTDGAMLLSDAQRSTLEQEAQAVSEQYRCGIYIITVDDFRKCGDPDSIYETAKTLYRQSDLGWGQEKSGVLLLLSMETRAYSLIAYGYGNTAFTDYGKSQLSAGFLDDFGEDHWYEGFTDYLKKSGEMLDDARDGHPLDVNTSPWIRLLSPVCSIALGVLIAFFAVDYLESKMNSVAKKTQADPYLEIGSVSFSRREDRFTHVTQTRRKIEKKSSDGGTTVDSDGFSGESGHF